MKFTLLTPFKWLLDSDYRQQIKAYFELQKTIATLSQKESQLRNDLDDCQDPAASQELEEKISILDLQQRKVQEEIQKLGE